MTAVPGVADARLLLDGDWSAAWSSAPAPAVSAWAEENRVLSGLDSGTGGPWRNDRAPYLAEILDAFAEPGVREIVVLKCAQSGGTEAWITMLCYAAAVAPRPALVVLPNDRLAASICRNRLLPEFRASPAVAAELAGGARGATSALVRFRRMRVRLTGSGSDANLASYPEAILIEDEVDKYDDPERVARLAEARTLTFRRPTIVKTSTPTDEGRGIAAEYARGDRRRWWVPCPACGGYQVLGFDSHVRWDGGLDAPLERVRATVRAECVLCGARVDEARKGWLLRRGLWLPEGVVPRDPLPVRDAAAVAAAALPAADPGRWLPPTEGTPAASAPGVRSYHIHGTMSPWQTWADLAEEFVAAGGEPTRWWVNEMLGEPYRARGVRGDEEDLLRAAAASADRPDAYRRGTVPPGAIVLTGAIDVQSDHVWYEVVGWGERGARYLIDYGTLYCPPAIEDERAAALRLPDALRGEEGLPRALASNPWLLVERMMDADYPRTDSGELERVRRWGVDCRWRRKEVYDLVRRRGPNVIATQGVDGDRMLALYYSSEETTTGRPETARPPARGAPRAKRVAGERPARAEDGWAPPRAVEVLSVNAWIWKGETMGRIQRPPDAPGAWRWPRDLTRAYAVQLLSEEIVEDRSSRRPKRVWRPRPGRAANHFWDCAVHGFALAHYLGLEQISRDDRGGAASAPDGPMVVGRYSLPR